MRRDAWVKGGVGGGWCEALEGYGKQGEARERRGRLLEWRCDALEWREMSSEGKAVNVWGGRSAESEVRGDRG